MVKLTAVKIGKLINRSSKYVYTLLHRKGISISDIDFEKLIDLIMQYRWKRWNVNGKKKIYCKGVVKQTAIKEYDKLFIKLYNECKEKYHNVCADCGKEGFWMVIHHIDGNHGNMIADNLVLLCTPCHWSRHTGRSSMGYKERMKEREKELKIKQEQEDDELIMRAIIEGA